LRCRGLDGGSSGYRQYRSRRKVAPPQSLQTSHRRGAAVAVSRAVGQPRLCCTAKGRASQSLHARPSKICPAPNHAVDLDLAQLREPSFKVEPPAFHLHAWFPGQGLGSVVTHQVPIGDFDGPHPFFGPDGRLL
jgi:Icc protein